MRSLGKIILTYNDIYEVNNILKAKDLKFKLHLHDACGSQSFTIEPLSNCACEGRYEEMKKTVKDCFKAKGVQIRFLENNLEFVIE